MSFKPNTTVYLCSGTGLDASNSVFMHKYAYSKETPEEASAWWNSLFQWFKAHSIAEGYWYYSYTDPSRGYIDVGRTPLSDGSAGEPGLGVAGKQAELDGNTVHYNEAIKAIEWVVFANGDGGSPFDVQYAMVERVDYVNFNTARVYFTVDALLTYQKYFWLGRCFVERDMQFDEWISTDAGRDSQTPTMRNINVQPEASAVAESDYIFQRMDKDSENQATLDALEFGAYNQMFCSTDVDIETIRASESASAVPSFDPSESTKVGDVQLGIGVYRYTVRKNEAFTKLGSFNAMEHILASYMLPEKVVKSQSEPIKFIDDVSTIVEDKYTGKEEMFIKFPVWFNDFNLINRDSEPENKFKPLNFKCYTAPYTYMSISDKQGSSLEILPQQIITENFTPTEKAYYTLNMKLNISAAPNMPSNLIIPNLRNAKGSEENPFMSMWQFSSYAMTPNNSGYNQVYVNNMAQANASRTIVFCLGALVATMVATPLTLSATGSTVLASAITGSSLYATGLSSASSIGLGFAGKSLQQSIYAEKTKESMMEYGLPKAVGGLPNNMTTFNMNNAGYEFYWCHMRTDLMKIADYMFSVMGYAQNCFRYPHVNTRKRWTYVKLKTVNLRSIAGDNYDKGGIPQWALRQIQERLTAGVTFWNLRHAMNETPIQEYSSMPDEAIKMNFVRNYGTKVDSEQMKDNADHCDGYASDYSDEAME